MISKKNLKFLFRSKSINLLKDKNRIGYKGQYIYKQNPIHYRTGSSDIEIIYEVLLKKGIKSEYWLPSSIKQKIIFNIGGNIGITSILLANKFPEAKIYTFEPIKSNFKLLSQNISYYKNIKGFNIALGAKNTKIDIFSSDNHSNFGGGSLYEKGVNLNKTEEIQMKTVKSILEQENIQDIDLVKIDTEGAEYDILTSFPIDILSKITWITGELHGENDFKLLDYLEKYFDISIKKKISNRLFMFNASNKKFTSNLNQKDIKNL